MVKKKVVLLFLLIVNIIYGQLRITNMRFNTNPYQFVLDIDGQSRPNYSINYDRGTRLLFLEIINSNLSNNISSIVNRNDDFIDNVVTMDFGDGRSNFFLTLKEGVNYQESIWSNPTRLVINFAKEKSNKPLIMIDAGHGGKDLGAVRGRYVEKDIVLSIALKLGKILEKDFNVIYTRKDDTFISLGNRARMANQKKSDLFVSIHANASPNSRASGVEVFYYSKTASDYAKSVAEFENSFDEKFGIKESEAEFIVSDITYNQNKERSHVLSQDMVRRLANTTGFINRGVHGAGFAVLKGSESPAMLVEVGFISNSNEAKLISTPSYQDKVAKEIAESIKNYYK